jgi:hypothetical protein
MAVASLGRFLSIVLSLSDALFFAYKNSLSRVYTATKPLYSPDFCIQNSSMTAKILSLAPATLHEQVAQRLRQMLVESRIKPGAKLNEREPPKAWLNCCPTVAPSPWS